MSSVVSCNVPNFADDKVIQRGMKKSSVGLPLPGVSTKITNPESYDKEMPPGVEGMLLVKGPSMMSSYFNDENYTQKVVHKGWFITGLIAKYDEDGFIYLSTPQNSSTVT